MPKTTAPAVPEEATGRLGTSILAALRSNGVEETTAARYAAVCTEMYRHICANPEVAETLKAAKDAYELRDGGQKAVTGSRYLTRSRAMGLTSAQNGFRSYGARGGAGVLRVFADYFETFARSQGIALNDCALAMSKLTLSLAGMSLGAVTAPTAFGLVMFAVSVHGLASDFDGALKSCLVE